MRQLPENWDDVVVIDVVVEFMESIPARGEAVTALRIC